MAEINQQKEVAPSSTTQQVNLSPEQFELFKKFQTYSAKDLKKIEKKVEEEEQKLNEAFNKAKKEINEHIKSINAEENYPQLVSVFNALANGKSDQGRTTVIELNNTWGTMSKLEKELQEAKKEIDKLKEETTKKNIVNGVSLNNSKSTIELKEDKTGSKNSEEFSFKNIAKRVLKNPEEYRDNYYEQSKKYRSAPKMEPELASAMGITH